MPLQCEIRRVDLQHQSGVDRRPVFDRERVGQRIQIVRVARVVRILDRPLHDAR